MAELKPQPPPLLLSRDTFTGECWAALGLICRITELCRGFFSEHQDYSLLNIRKVHLSPSLILFPSLPPSCLVLSPPPFSPSIPPALILISFSKCNMLQKGLLCYCDVDLSLCIKMAYLSSHVSLKGTYWL